MPEAFDELYERVKHIDQAVCKGGLDSVSAHERTAYLVWGASGIIGNGGFWYFYEGARNALEIAAAYEALGYTEAADAFRRSLSVFPDSEPHLSDEDRIRWMDTHEGRILPFFEQLDTAVPGSLDDALMTRILEHLRESD